MKSLNVNDFEKCFAILEICEVLTVPNLYGIFTSLRALTFNNFGCYYRRKNDPANAYENLQKSLKLINLTSQKEYLGLTYLNLCAILS